MPYKINLKKNIGFKTKKFDCLTLKKFELLVNEVFLIEAHLTYDSQKDGVLEGRPFYEEQSEPPDEVGVTEYEEGGGSSPRLHLDVLLWFCTFIHPGYYLLTKTDILFVTNEVSLH